MERINRSVSAFESVEPSGKLGKVPEGISIQIRFRSFSRITRVWTLQLGQMMGRRLLFHSGSFGLLFLGHTHLGHIR